MYPSRVDDAEHGFPSLGSDRIVSGDVGVLVWVGRDVRSVVESGSGFAGFGCCRGDERAAAEVGRADGFAVPACALAVDLAVGYLPVYLAGPFEAIGEPILVDFVVVVDEFGHAGMQPCVVDGVLEVSLGGKLMRVPGEVHVEGGDGHALRMRRHDVEEHMVFADQAAHSCHHSRRVQPVDVIHLLDERPLSDNRPDQI